MVILRKPCFYYNKNKVFDVQRVQKSIEKSIRKPCKNMTRKSYAKMIKNDAQIKSKSIQQRPKLWSKVDAKIDAKIDAKRHPQKEGRREGRQPP